MKRRTGNIFIRFSGFFLLVCLTGGGAFAQSMGISNVSITPDASSILELRTTTKGLLIPRMTTTERDAITSPATGLMIYNTTTGKFNFYNGSTWISLFSGSSGVNSITGTYNRITIGGTASDPTVDISASYTGQNTITTLGTIGTGTWNGTLIDPVYGGTGVNNGAKTITLGGNFTTAGAFGTTFTATGTTNLTLPTTGTLSTLAGTETLTNKTMSGASNTFSNIATSSLTGTLQAAQFPALTGDVTTSAGSLSASIAGNAVTNSQLAQVATQTFKGRTTAGTGNVEDLTATQATALLDNFTSTTKGLTPLSGGGTTNYLRADGTWTNPIGSLSSSYWAFDGNNVPATKNFGTTSNYDLPFITNNTEKLRITSSGNLGLGTSAFDGTNPEKFLIDAGTTSSYNLIKARGSINNYLQFNIQNTSTGTSASSDVVATADNGTESVNYIDMGINSSTYSNVSLPIVGGVNNAYLYSTGNDFVIGNTTAAKPLRFFTGGTANSNERMRIDGSGNVAIGNTTAVELLTLGTAGTIAGTLSLAGATSGKAILTTSAVAGTPTITLPAATGTLATLAGTETLTNKTMSGASNTFSNIAMSSLTGTLGAGNGGTGNASYTVGDLLYASGTSTLSKLAGVATGNALISGGTSTAPSWGKIGLTTHVSGTLPIANGGTNSTATPTNGGIMYGDGTSYQVTAAGTSGQVLKSNGTNAPTWADGVNIVTLGSDVVNNNAVANTIADVTGLSFSVTAGVTYRFRALIYYTAAATTTGSRWSINGPATPTLLAYTSQYSLTATTSTTNNAAAYDIPAASNATSTSTAGNIAQIDGIIKPSANGTVIVRFASEIANSAITAKAGSTLTWW